MKTKRSIPSIPARRRAAACIANLVAEVWADNWFALYVNGELVGEVSVPITTERSFNAETFSFEATYPLSADWLSLVVHRAPLNTDCERDADPDATCQFESIESPEGWTTADFDDSTWTSASVWSEAEVSPKDGYDQITWDSSATLIWGTDLEVDNTVLLRVAVDA